MVNIRTVFLVLLISFLSKSLIAQTETKKYWFTGDVTLKTGETKRGNVLYDFPTNTIQLAIGDKVEAYHAHYLQSFTIYSEGEALKRSFFILPYKSKAGLKRPTMFELLFEGKVSLLAREIEVSDRMSEKLAEDNFVRKASENEYQEGEGPMVEAVKGMAFELFLVDVEGNVKKVQDTRGSILKGIGDHQKELKSYIKKEKLQMRSIIDIVKLLKYYDQLEQE